jgi:hypothetical protein
VAGRGCKCKCLSELLLERFLVLTWPNGGGRRVVAAERVRQVATWGVADSLLVTSYSGISACGEISSETANFERIKARISR